MKSFTAVAALACIVAAGEKKNHWAVIMAGSNTYSNYRHQADSHHAVKIMLENGIPRDQIIHLAYDDVANSTYNPLKGQLFNKPTPAGTPGVNVYDQSEIDYSGSECNSSNFLKVLVGDDTATGPVLKSDSESHVFVYFVDHGGAGLICTPQGSSDWIYADQLDSTLQQMKDQNMFKELTFYLEACESGSMFPNLNADESIYAMTASNASLSSWAAYCGSDATVNGTNINSCLGDLFSINWMEDTESNNKCHETLSTQQATVIAKTTQSPVQTFGDSSFLGEAIGRFQGTCKAKTNDYSELINDKYAEYSKMASDAIFTSDRHVQTVDSRENKLHYLSQRVMSEGSPEAYAELQAEMDHRQFIDSLFEEHFGEVSNANDFIQDYDCLRMMVGEVEELCGSWSDYSLKYVRKLANACNSKTTEEIATLVGKIGTTCQAF